MKTLMKSLLLVLACTVTVATLPAAPMAEAGITRGEAGSYALREAQAAGLEQFEGGWHGAVVGFFLIIGIIVFVDLAFCGPHSGHHHGPHHRHPL